MIAYRMLYVVAVGLPIVAAAFVVAATLRRYGRPERWVWLVGLCLALVLPAVYLVGPMGTDVDPMPGSIGPGVAAPETGEEPGAVGLRFPNVIRVSGGEPGFGLDEALLLAWLATSAGLALRWLVSSRRLSRLEQAWTPDRLDGSGVWLTRASGPAVTGVLRTRILVPRWLLALPTAQRSLVLLHEEEHLRARDPWLMVASRVARILTPWNPVVWLLSARLLRAVETDCDRRVLRWRPDVRAYCDTLLTISARRPSRLVGAAAFAEPQIPLKQRIVAMTTPPRSVPVLAATGLAALGLLFVASSCGVPLPTQRDDDPRAAVVDTGERVVTITVDGSETVSVGGEPYALSDVSSVIDGRVAAATRPVVARIDAPSEVPYRLVDALQTEIVAGGVTRVVFRVDGGDGLGIVLPGADMDLPVSNRNVLVLDVRPSGDVEVRRGSGERTQRLRPRDVTALWREEVALNPELIASVHADADPSFGQVMDVLEALYSANAQRISLWKLEAQ